MRGQNLERCEADLSTQGWARVDLPDPQPVEHVRRQLLDHLRADRLASLESLEQYHRHVESDERHVEILHALASFYWQRNLGRQIIEANLGFFRQLLGPDLLIQRYPYLRAVRPDADGDAAPMHRDTYYGASAFELSIVVPLTEMGVDGAVRVISGSHVEPDHRYPFERRVSADVTPRSPKHELGFPYAPKVLGSELWARAEPVALKVGQALVFGLSLVHGGGVNRGVHTRFSTDIRLANALAPVETSRGVRSDYFVPLCESVVTRTARRYLAANET